MNKKIKDHSYCPISHATKIVGDAWCILIIRDLMDGCKRFNEIHEDIEGITNSTLSDRLKRLVEEGIVERKQYESIPPKVEYTLTEKGKDLSGLVKSVEKFGNKWYQED